MIQFLNQMNNRLVAICHGEAAEWLRGLVNSSPPPFACVTYEATQMFNPQTREIQTLHPARDVGQDVLRMQEYYRQQLDLLQRQHADLQAAAAPMERADREELNRLRRTTATDGQTIGRLRDELAMRLTENDNLKKPRARAKKKPARKR